MEKILVTGAFGQIGSELVLALREKYGGENVIATGRKTQPSEKIKESGPVDFVNVLEKDAVFEIVKKYKIDTIYHLAAIISAKGEQNPQLAYQVDLNGVFNILEAGRELNLERIMIPSSMAVFGPETPRDNTPNETITKPTTMYGVTKVAGELLGNYYFHKYGLDVRGLRYPGILSSEAAPGGGTTDYAVEVFYDAIKTKKYTCFLKEDTVLPMMYMPDALKAIMDLADADISKLKHHCDFNVAAISFSPKEIVAEIQKYIPDFTCEYKPDFRQDIADSWPRSLDDSVAREEWGWQHKYDLPTMVKDMYEKLSVRLK